MSSPTNNYKVCCFGEILWDLFPSGKHLGGAPFNVAYHLTKQGIKTTMISAIGTDALGTELTERIQALNVPLDLIQIVPHKPTGTVVATIDKLNEAHYQITEEVAWDYISYQPSFKTVLENNTTLVFGSLATRSITSYNTLLQLIEQASYTVFDVNIRLPYFNFTHVNVLLQKANTIKLNEAELENIVQLLGKKYTSIEESSSLLLEHYNATELIITKGSKGVYYKNAETEYKLPAIQVDVADTVGSGDAFLAGYLAAKIKGYEPVKALKHAVTLGALVTSKQGACPSYSLKEFQKFLSTSKI